MTSRPASPPSPRRVALGAELLRLRTLAGLSGREVGKRIKVGQATVSRMENGEARVPLPKARAWAEAVGATPEQRDHLLALAEAALNEIVTWREKQQEGLPAIQEQVRLDESTSRMRYCFQPALVPGLLQTAEYARRVFALVDVIGDGDYAGAVAKRLERQKILYREEYRFEFILTEAALRLRICPPPAMDAQLAHIGSVSTLTNVEVRVIPCDADARAIPWCGFNLYDERGELDPFVRIELPHAGVTVDDPDDVALYRRQIGLLREASIPFHNYIHR